MKDLTKKDIDEINGMVKVMRDYLLKTYGGFVEIAVKFNSVNPKIDKDYCDELVDTICLFLKIPPEQIRWSCREKPFVYARCLFCHLASINAQSLTLKEIGYYINRNHATVIHAKKRADYLLMWDNDFADLNNNVIEAMNNQRLTPNKANTI
jgi:chromosomal replication initiation ATPase DnaA